MNNLPVHIQSLAQSVAEDRRFAAKVTRLATLARAGLPVPATMAVAIEITPWLALANDHKLVLCDLLRSGLPANSPLPFIPARMCLRSGSPVEDNADASGAGALDSLFDLTPESFRFDKVRQQIVAFVDRQIHATRRQIPRAPWISFLWQQQIPVTQSGILFTRHPSALIPNIMLSELHRGHGLKLTGGRVRPRQLWFAAEDGRPLVTDGQKYHRPFAAWKQQLGQLAIRCRELFPEENGLDIEWCRLGSIPVILQLRPLTGRPPSDDYLWNGALGDEFWSGRVSHFMFATVGRAIEVAMVRRPLATLPDSREWKMPILKHHGSRIYFNSGVLGSLYSQLPGWGQIPALQQMVNPDTTHQDTFSVFPLMTRRFVRLLIRLLLARPLWLPWQPLHQTSLFCLAGERLLQCQRTNKNVSLPQAVAHLEHYLDSTVWGMVWVYVLVQICQQILARLLPDQQIRTLLWRSNPDDPVYKMHQDLWKAHLQYQTTPTEAVAAIVRRYGHATSARDISHPRWSEEHETIRQIISRMTHPPCAPQGSLQATMSASTQLWSDGRWLRGLTLPLFLPLVWLVRRLTAWREQMRTVSDLYLACLRDIALAQGIDTDSSRLWDLDPWTGNLHPAKNDAAQSTWMRGNRPADTSSMRLRDKQDLMGTPVFGGEVYGTICSLEQLLLNELPPNPILVSDYLDPSVGPLLPELTGAIFESGGTLSHGGILAREYAIPCLCGARGAVRRLPVGSTVLLDSLNGFVRRIKPDKSKPERGNDRHEAGNT